MSAGITDLEAKQDEDTGFTTVHCIVRSQSDRFFTIRLDPITDKDDKAIGSWIYTICNVTLIVSRKGVILGLSMEIKLTCKGYQDGTWVVGYEDVKKPLERILDSIAFQDPTYGDPESQAVLDLVVAILKQRGFHGILHGLINDVLSKIEPRKVSAIRKNTTKDAVDVQDKTVGYVRVYSDGESSVMFDSYEEAMILLVDEFADYLKQLDGELMLTTTFQDWLTDFAEFYEVKADGRRIKMV